MDPFMENPDASDWFSSCIPGSTQSNTQVDTHFDTIHGNNDDSTEDDEKKGASPRQFRRGSKPHSTPMTLKWLEENYEIAEGVCIPRSTLYVHYLDFCEINDTNPVNAASFGKIIRQQFPQITTRRLGTRGQSKYHYYGIGVRESSSYYEVMYSAKAAHSSNDGKKDTTKQVVAYSPRSKLGTLLPDFPDVSVMKLPQDVEEHKVVTFLMMYRTHCQRILDTVIRANFDEVQNFLLHFWQGMPTHIIPILSNDVIVKLIGVCDAILYKAIAGVLMPTVLQALPDSLTQVIRRFAKQLEEWLGCALDGLPDALKTVKVDLSRRFAQVLRRQMSLNHLVQASRTVVNSPDIMVQLLSDWLNVDLNSIVKQTLYTMDHYTERDHRIIVDLCTEFEKLLDEQAPMEAYVDWLDTMVQSCVVKISQKRVGSLRCIARQFLLMWSCFGTRVIRDMTLHSAPSFGSFHLLHLMFDDYVLYLIESLHTEERANEFLRVVKGEAVDADPNSDVILPDPSLIRASFLSPWGSERGHGGVNRGHSGESTHYNMGRGDNFFDYDSQSESCSSEDESLDGSSGDLLHDVTSHGAKQDDYSQHTMVGNTLPRSGLSYQYSGMQQHQHHPLQHQPVQPLFYGNAGMMSHHQQQQQTPQQQLDHNAQYTQSGFSQNQCYQNPPHLGNARTRDELMEKSANKESHWSSQSRDINNILPVIDPRSQGAAQASRSTNLTSTISGVYQFAANQSKPAQHNMAAIPDAYYCYQGYGTMAHDIQSSHVGGSDAMKRKHDSISDEAERTRNARFQKRTHRDTGFYGHSQQISPFVNM